MSAIVETRPGTQARTAFAVLVAISVCHLLNDMMQVLLPAIYPLLKGGFHLNFAQIGLITLVYQITASILQPMVGLYTDARPQPFSLPFGMGFTLIGLVGLAFAASYPELLAAAALLGVGSSIFHPESSRIARVASGGRHGFAQSLFQVGGNLGQSLGPLLAAFFILPRGRESMAWFSLAALLAMAILTAIGVWFRANGHAKPRVRQVITAGATAVAAPARVMVPLVLLGVLMMSKFVYLASINSYYIFYLMHRFHLSVRSAQVDLFIFLAAAAAGTMIGGPIGDRIGRRAVIIGSILGVLPFTLVLPYVGLDATIVLTIFIGLILSSAFSAIVVFANDLMPGRIGAVSGLFFGLAFGVAGLGAAGLGVVADWTSITTVYRICAFLPVLGLAALWLPKTVR
ncbi:MFS transporter [Acidiphilium sp.]|uniref:MFS transporter n=1 Tax=Acidiphilium sp. TaxID=527 RepID=UPI003CFC5000